VNTFAGGTVMDAMLGRWRRRDSARLGSLPGVHRGGWPELLLGWIEGAGLAAPSAEELAGRLGVASDAVEAPLGRLLTDHRIRALPTRPPRLVAASRLDRLAAAAAEQLRRRLEGEEVSAGIPARDFAGALLPRSLVGMADVYLEVLRQLGVVELSQGRVVPPGSDRHMTAAGEQLTGRLEALYREARFEPPPPAEAAARLGEPPTAVEGICRYLVQRGRMVRLEGKLLIHRDVLDEVARSVESSGLETFTVGDFKERFGLTRKLAIPILEWLDAERVTVRHGDARKVVLRRSPAPNSSP